ncbi:hypothetical protein CDD83_10993 [Cordyceps sp. RAO-2017]|nr:hypothetical protein CDD83_10993 [Cordyceps sp. RAO-2017]
MAEIALSGAVFGAAMTASGFHDPSIIAAQMRFQNWHMMQTFLAATASSALVYSAAERLGHVRLPSRCSSPLALFSKYDGNVIGGLLLGTGIALSASCPGALYAQLAAGVPAAVYTLAGAVAAGVLWAGYLADLVQRRRRAMNATPEPCAVHEQLRLSRPAALLLLVAACVALVALTASHGRPSPGANVVGAVGGLLIGLAQLVSLVARRSMIGVSASYEEAGTLFWSLVAGFRRDPTPRPYRSLLFGLGVVAGAWGLLHAAPSFAVRPAFEARPLFAAAGGFAMALGASMAGGCTSGHGISGISLLSASSLVSIASTFAAGALVAALVH